MINPNPPSSIRNSRVELNQTSDLSGREDVQPSNFASSETLAFSKREMGQPALAPLAMAVNLAWSMPGMLAVMSKCDSVTVKPASVLSNVMVAVVWMAAGVNPALPSSAENAIEKQPACDAAINSSGFVPTPFSKRVLNEYCVSLSTPLSVEMLPLPLLRSPFQTADALRFI